MYSVELKASILLYSTFSMLILIKIGNQYDQFVELSLVVHETSFSYQGD